MPSPLPPPPLNDDDWSEVPSSSSPSSGRPSSSSYDSESNYNNNKKDAGEAADRHNDPDINIHGSGEIKNADSFFKRLSGGSNGKGADGEVGEGGMMNNAYTNDDDDDDDDSAAVSEHHPRPRESQQRAPPKQQSWASRLLFGWGNNNNNNKNNVSRKSKNRVTGKSKENTNRRTTPRLEPSELEDGDDDDDDDDDDEHGYDECNDDSDMIDVVSTTYEDDGSQQSSNVVRIPPLPTKHPHRALSGRGGRGGGGWGSGWSGGGGGGSGGIGGNGMYPAATTTTTTTTMAQRRRSQAMHHSSLSPLVETDSEHRGKYSPNKKRNQKYRGGGDTGRRKGGDYSCETASESVSYNDDSNDDDGSVLIVGDDLGVSSSVSLDGEVAKLHAVTRVMMQRMMLYERQNQHVASLSEMEQLQKLSSSIGRAVERSKSSQHGTTAHLLDALLEEESLTKQYLKQLRHDRVYFARRLGETNHEIKNVQRDRDRLANEISDLRRRLSQTNGGTRQSGSKRSSTENRNDMVGGCVQPVTHPPSNPIKSSSSNTLKHGKSHRSSSPKRPMSGATTTTTTATTTTTTAATAVEPSLVSDLMSTWQDEKKHDYTRPPSRRQYFR